ncbi:MAG: dihydroorotate dehydrogenase electron transfer subunit [Clostridiales Family XIII bacterium]|nr:dihydroorotate dehydrogenase electron transfer subunit [Clostridiales Family XIII bacterium]
MNNERLADGVFEIVLEAPEIAARAVPGQFVNLYLPGGAMLLPRPLGIADVSPPRTVTLVYAVVGAGTERLSQLPAGRRICAMGPLGNGFLAKIRFTRLLLIGGGMGAAPLRFAARRFREPVHSELYIEAFLGFAAEPWGLASFGAACDHVHVASDTQGAAAFHGTVVDLLEKRGRFCSSPGAGGTLALACGPMPMLKAAAAWCEARGIPLRVSLEARMGCGYGACASCTCETTAAQRKKICTDGPCFDAEEILW